MCEEMSRNEQDYNILVQLLISENNRYHGILSTYLTANAILIAALFVAIDKIPFPIAVLMGVAGIFICFQWWISLSRSKKLHMLRLRQLREMERRLKANFFLEGQKYIVEEEPLPRIPPKGQLKEKKLEPDKHGNRWYGKRAAFMPFIFGLFYVLVIVSSIFRHIDLPGF